MDANTRRDLELMASGRSPVGDPTVALAKAVLEITGHLEEPPALIPYVIPTTMDRPALIPGVQAALPPYGEVGDDLTGGTLAGDELPGAATSENKEN